MYLDLFSEKAPCGSILVSDHSVFAFWVVAFVRFDCTTKIFLLLSQVDPTEYCKRKTHSTSLKDDPASRSSSLIYKQSLIYLPETPKNKFTKLRLIK